MTRQEILSVAKPILFNTDMVRVISDDRKTATRRVIKQDVEAVLQSQARANNPGLSDSHFIQKLCFAPYKPGDYLYVRETWAAWSPTYGIAPKLYYKADNGTPTGIKWRPSIHMPKEAARIFLRVTGVRVERLREIKNFRAEGVASESCDECFIVCGGCDPDKSPTGCDNEAEAFANLWDSTIKPADLPVYGWEANPWVWVIEFERVTPEGVH